MASWRAIVTSALPIIAASAALAQWPAYPTQGVPQTPQGKPDLAGPTPRTAGGKPDLSGIWQFVRQPMPAGTSAMAAARSANDITPLIVRLSQFWNLGAAFKDGLPFTPWAADLHRERVANNSRDNPDAHCLPLGLMQLHTHSQPRKVIQTPGLMVILYEANAGMRQIFTDGRPLPANPEPWWFGYSTGKWDGDTLVVETSGFRDLGWLDVEGSPLSDQGKIIERFRRPDFGHLEIETTIDDPKSYIEPWTVTIHQRIMLNTELIEFVCLENEKDDSHLTGANARP